MLHKLPVEIVLDIASFLDTDDENDNFELGVRPDLDSLRQCSRHLYEVFTPLRFRDIGLRMTNSFSAGGFWRQSPDGLAVVYFSKLLVNKPYIAGFVRSLELFAYPGPDSCFSPIEPAPSRAEYERIVWSACCSESESQKWLDDLLDGNEDAFIALLLVQLKELDTLKLTVPEADRCPHLTRVIHRAAEPGGCGYLSKLKNVWVSEGPTSEDYKSGYSQLTLPRLAPFFHLPSIRRFKSWHLSTAAPSSAWQTGFFDRQSPVTSISFYHVMGMGLPPDLPDLISSCTRLESFEYMPDMWIDEGYNDTLDPTVFYSPLRYSISTFETLSLRIDPRVPDYPMAPNLQGRQFFGSLSGFTALKNVQMRMSELIPFYWYGLEPASALTDRLPASLEVLHITHVHTEALPYLVKNSRTWFDSGIVASPC